VNEQIKLFAEQARLLTGWPVGEVEYQKFAELLIFECMKIAVFNGNHVTAVAIKEKFGVGK
jgi:hypothetical protein